MLHQSGKSPQRGFGGRLIFYGEEKDKPVLVEGQLVVYAFDESQRDPTDNKPTRRYVFPPDQVARRMSKTSLGPSYSFWLPWDDVGGLQTEVSLIARFEPTHGSLIMSEQTRHMLPGQTTPSMIASKVAPKLPAGVPSIPAATTLASLAEQAQATTADGSVRLASYDAGTGQAAAPLAEQPAAAPSSSSPEPQRRMTTTSISLPENFRITNNGVPQTVRAGEPVLPGNMIAQPGGAAGKFQHVVRADRRAAAGQLSGYEHAAAAATAAAKSNGDAGLHDAAPIAARKWLRGASRRATVCPDSADVEHGGAAGSAAGRAGNAGTNAAHHGCGLADD